MGENMNQLEGVLYIEGQPVGEIGEFTIEPEEISDILHLNDSAEFTGTITLTPEQQEAIKKEADLMEKVWKTVKAVLDQLKEIARTIWEQVCELYAQAELAESKGINNLMDAILCAANDNPKWWHLYKHAKKYRTRKKYRRLLMQQLLSKLSAANAQEA